MKTSRILSAALLAVLAGCSGPEKSTGLHAGDMLLGASLERAIIAQATLFPYHFEVDGKELNELGRRDVAVLADHLRDHAGVVSVRRGDSTPALHESRLGAVMAALEAAGVAHAQITLRDGLARGEGLSSVRVVEVLKKPLVLTGAGVSSSIQSATSTSGEVVSP